MAGTITITQNEYNGLTSRIESLEQHIKKIETMVRAILHTKQHKHSARGVTTLEAIADLKLNGGPADLSNNLDQYLYGQKTENNSR